MWFREYRDYKIDAPLVKQRVEAANKSIAGCQMQELNGWGETYHRSKKRKNKGIVGTFFERLFTNF